MEECGQDLQMFWIIFEIFTFLWLQGKLNITHKKSLIDLFMVKFLPISHYLKERLRPHSILYWLRFLTRWPMSRNSPVTRPHCLPHQIKICRQFHHQNICHRFGKIHFHFHINTILITLRLKIGWDFEDKSRQDFGTENWSRFWSLSLFNISKLKFGRDFCSWSLVEIL